MGGSMTSWERSKEANRRRKRPEPPPQARVAEPFGPPPIEYLSRGSVCGEERLVNEAIMEVGMGMVQFPQDYHEGCMPKVGCSGCNSYTMEYVEQEPSSARRALA